MALQLAGLQAQVLWGQFDRVLMNRYEEINQYLPHRIIAGDKTRTPSEWSKKIAEAHEVGLSAALLSHTDTDTHTHIRMLLSWLHI